MKTQQCYQIQLFTQLGTRSGVLAWTEENSLLSGTLELLNHQTPFTGQISSSGCYDFSGQVKTLVSCIPYHAVCTLQGSQLQGVFHTSSGDYPVKGISNPVQ